MSASLADLYATAAQILALFIGQLEAQGVELPERQEVRPGQIPAWDGEQLTVNLVGVSQGQPGLQQAGSLPPLAVSYHAQFRVSLVRAVAVVQSEGPLSLQTPSSEQIDEDGRTSLGDGAGLLRAAQTIHSEQLLTDPGEGFTAELQTLGPEGGLAAASLLLTMSVD